MLYNQGSSSTDESIFDAKHNQKRQNVVSPDNDSSNRGRFGFSFCCVMDSLQLCGESHPVSVMGENDDDDTAGKMDSLHAADEIEQLQIPSTLDPMSEDSYISVRLTKPIGIRFEENYSNFGGVFVADINSEFSCSSIRRGYQLVAVGEKRVSGMDFDQAVMEPIVDNVEEDVMLVLFKGSAECLYDKTSGASEEWLDSFVEMNAKRENMRNVDVKDFDSGVEIIASTSNADSEDEMETKVVEESNNLATESTQVTEAETANETPSLHELTTIGDLDIQDGADDFFVNVLDLNTTASFDWTPQKQFSQDSGPVLSDNVDISSWNFPDYSVIETSQDDARESSSSNQAPEVDGLNESVSMSEINVDVENDFVSGGGENSENKGNVVDDKSGVTMDEVKNDEAVSRTSTPTGDEENGIPVDDVPTTKSEDDNDAYVESIGNCTTPNVDASYNPSSGFVLRKDKALPEISKDQVLVRVDATTLSTRDCLERFRRDKNDKLKDVSWVPSHEIVGRVVRAGKRAKIFLDRRVAALLSHGGGCSRYIRIHAKDLISLPETVDSNEIVALLSTYLPAYQCLECMRREDDGTSVDPPPSTTTTKDDSKTEVSPSPTTATEQKKSPLSEKSVLITGAGSPVGAAVLDIAAQAGASVYAVSHSSFEKDIREMGVKEWYPLYKRNEWKTEWSSKMDLIVDTVGDYEYYPMFYEVMVTGGKFIRVNTTSCEKKYVPKLGEQVKVFSALKDYKGSRINTMALDYDVLKSFNDDQEMFTEDLAYLYQLLAIGKIEPRVFSRVGFDDLEEEWEKIMGGGANGVVIVSPWKD